VYSDMCVQVALRCVLGLPSIKRATVSQQIKIILQCAQAEGRLYFDELSKKPTILRQKRKDFEKNA